MAFNAGRVSFKVSMTAHFTLITAHFEINTLLFYTLIPFLHECQSRQMTHEESLQNPSTFSLYPILAEYGRTVQEVTGPPGVLTHFPT